MKSRPKGMSYDTYKSTCMKKGDDPMSEEDFAKLPEDEDEGGGGEDGADKGYGVGDLMKALGDYDAVEQGLTKAGTSRTAYLTERLTKGTITTVERTELGKLLAAEPADAPRGGQPFAKSVTATTAADPASADLRDASPFLKSLVEGIDDRLDEIGTEVLRDGRATRELLKAQGGLIKGMARVMGAQSERLERQDHVIKALESRLGIVERTPAKPRAVTADPRAVRTADPVAKGGERGADDKLTRTQVNAGLDRLIKSASDRDDDAAIQALSHATSLYETTGRLPPNVEQAIRGLSAA